MGCIQKHQQITIKKPLIHNKTTFYSNYKNTFSLFDRFSTLGNSDDDLKFYYKNKSNKLTKQSWIRVLSFLKFNELKEIGKINRMFHMIIKQNIPKKFFKKEKLFYN